MLIEAPGSSLLEHPINVVLWIRDSLKADGIALKKGGSPVARHSHEADTDGAQHSYQSTLRRPGPERACRDFRYFQINKAAESSTSSY
jgi:hypothetical protein